MDPATQVLDPIDRPSAALTGMFVGDALAMPVHWYYDRRALSRDYGHVTDYLPPRNPHPDSILWRSSYRPSGPKGDILHDQARFWGRSGIHYHQFLQAGENTLNLKLSALLIESLNQQRAYRAGAIGFLDRWSRKKALYRQRQAAFDDRRRNKKGTS